MIELISSNDGSEQARQRAKREAQRAADSLRGRLQELAANILRVAAGAGSPSSLIGEMVEVLKADAEFQRHPQIVDDPLAAALRDREWRKYDDRYPVSSGQINRQRVNDTLEQQRDAEEEMRRHALRFVAAQLMAQPTQESAADNGFREAMRRWIEAHERLAASAIAEGFRR